MNTKAFVNGFDPENTVKGYYDENDQLVLVEPEGSGGGGGGGDVRTATVTLSLRAKTPIPTYEEGVFMVVYEKNYNGIVPIIGDELYIETGADFDPEVLQVTGDAVIDEDSNIIITGDCSIVPKEDEGV